MACLLLHVCARYNWGWGHHKDWQAVHVLVGLAYVTAILHLTTGPSLWRRIDRRTLGILLGTLGVSQVFWYFGRADTYNAHLSNTFVPSGPLSSVFPFIYLAIGATVFRLLIPLAACGVAGIDLESVGLKRGPPRGPPLPNSGKASSGRSDIWKVYLALYLLILPVLWWASTTPAFQARYPLARTMITAEGTIAWEQFLGYQAFYLLIFVSGEALYRGLMTFGLHRRLGLYGIAYMLVPYVFSHFGKPQAETLGAVGSGALLAYLALRHRSIWLGVALHYAVALTMDVLAMTQNGIRLS